MRFGRTGSSSPALCAVLLVIGHATLAPRGAGLLPIAAAAMLVLSWRVSPRLLAALASLVLLVDVSESVRSRLLSSHEAERGRAGVARRVNDLESRERTMADGLLAAAQEIAALPETRAALTEGASARAPLFTALITRNRGHYQGRFPQSVALAIENDRQETVAWAGRVGSPWSAARAASRGSAAAKPPEHPLFVSEGAVSATLVAVARIEGPDGRLIGHAIVELPLATRRQIHNDFLSDLDLLSADDDSVAVAYRDVNDAEEEAMAELPGPPPDTAHQRGMLRAPDGLALAAYQVTARLAAVVALETHRAYEGAVGGTATLWLAAWVWLRRRATGRTLGPLALAATLGRAVWLLLPLPLPEAMQAMASPDVYASRWIHWLPGYVQHLVDSPLHLLLTTFWLVVVVSWLVRASVRAPARWPLAAPLADLLSLFVIAGTLLWVGDTCFQSTIELDQVALLPHSGAQLMLQSAVLLLVLIGGAVVFVLQTSLARWPTSTTARILRVGSWLALGVVADLLWPRERFGLPLFSAVALFAVPTALVIAPRPWRLAWWGGRLASATAFAGAMLLLAEVILQPAVVYFAEKDHRLQIEQEDVPLVRHQQAWQEDILTRTRRRIDAMNVLQDLPPDSDRTGIEQLAFAIWSRTDLATEGLSSAIEIQDETGTLVSRFALNMPSFSAEPTAFPGTAAWRVDWDVLRLLSTESRARHAQRRLAYEGRLYGAIHVYVADDFWNLPFLQGRDPYPTLFRSTSPDSRRQRSAHLVVYDALRHLVFSSAERPPGLAAALRWPLPPPPAGSWRTVAFGDSLRHVYFFQHGARTYGLSLARTSPAQYAGNIVEATAGAALVPIAVALVVMLLRSLAGRKRFSLAALHAAVTSRFSVRLFTAFVVLAAVPIAVIDAMMHRFLEARLAAETERQALAQVAVARKAVEDYAFTQAGEGGPRATVTDTAALWAATLIRNDLDIFQNGVVSASSKRELYASGLLGRRVSGTVYRALVLEGEPSVIRTDRIGEFSYMVACMPVHLDAREPAVLCIPLALRQREVQAVLDDMHRTINVGSVLFLVLAAVFAGRMARRISGPIRDLTAATERIAAGDLETRVTADSRDELRQLVLSFNRMARDLDAQRRELERSNRLAAWAEMARQVAHEVKNPLTPIQLSAQHLQRVFKNGTADFGAALETCTTTILEQVRKLREIATEFSAYARPPAADRARASLPALVRKAMTPYRAALPVGVRLEDSLPDDMPEVRVDGRLLDRALVNLLENALHAVGDSGVVRVIVRHEPRRAIVDVVDSGSGIDPAIRDRIFEPFFSTKSSGSGLGLALVKKIVEDHGGGVELDSAPGRGTRVTVWLPVDETQQT